MNDVEGCGNALRWLSMTSGVLVDVSVIMEIGPTHVWSISGAPDAMQWLAAGETHVKTYI